MSVKELSANLLTTVAVLFGGLGVFAQSDAGGGGGAILSPLQAAALVQEAEQLFNEGNARQAAGDSAALEYWRKAARRYERLIREGDFRNGAVFYNLGNIYFRLDDIGRAILNYRRAQRFLPRDPNLLRNLAFVRSCRRDHIAEPERTRVLKTVFFWHYDLPLPWRENGFLAAFAAFWSFALLGRLRRRRAWPRWCGAAAAVAALALAASLAVEEWNRAKHRPGVILSQQVIARKGDSESYEPSFTEPLHAGTEFTLITRRGEWLEIALADNRTCWIPRQDAEMVGLDDQPKPENVQHAQP